MTGWTMACFVFVLGKSDDSCVPGNPNHEYIYISLDVYVSLDGATTEAAAVRR